jgi:hypothetical protein
MDGLADPDTPTEYYVETIQKVSKKAKECLLKMKEWMMRQWDKNKKKSEEYEVSEEVLASSERLLSNRPSKKLDDKWRGLFKIIGKKGPSAYELDLLERWKGYRVFNEGWLK